MKACKTCNYSWRIKYNGMLHCSYQNRYVKEKSMCHKFEIGKDK